LAASLHTVLHPGTSATRAPRVAATDHDPRMTDFHRYIVHGRYIPPPSNPSLRPGRPFVQTPVARARSEDTRFRNALIRVGRAKTKEESDVDPMT
jgi:hypothetical protein